MKGWPALFFKIASLVTRNFQYSDGFSAGNNLNFGIRLGIGVYRAGPFQLDLFAGGNGSRVVSLSTGSPQRFVERIVALRGTYYLAN